MNNPSGSSPGDDFNFEIVDVVWVCSIFLPHGFLGWYVVCDFGIVLSYLLVGFCGGGGGYLSHCRTCAKTLLLVSSMDVGDNSDQKLDL